MQSRGRARIVRSAWAFRRPSGRGSTGRDNLRPAVSIRLVVLALAAALALALAGPAAAERYVVLYPEHGWGVWGAKHDVTKAGGSVVAAYPQIDVVIAESDDPGFAATLDRNRRVEGVAPVGSVVATASGWGWDWDGHGLPSSPVVDADTFSPLQWYSQRIDAPEAHAITGGSPKVARRRHRHRRRREPHRPERQRRPLAQRLLRRRRAEPGSGRVERRLRPRDERRRRRRRRGERLRHRRHRAERQARGDQGEHPQRRRATSSSPTRSSAPSSGPRSTASTWPTRASRSTARSAAGTTTFCRNDPAQRTIIKAVKRAVDYAHRRDVSMVASAGNNGLDLAEPGARRVQPAAERAAPRAHRLVDRPQRRPRRRARPRTTASATIDLTAPGGDFLQGVPPAGPRPRPLAGRLPGAAAPLRPVRGPGRFVLPLLCGHVPGGRAGERRGGARRQPVRTEELVVGREDGSGPRFRLPAPDGGPAALPGRRCPLRHRRQPERLLRQGRRQRAPRRDARQARP